MGYRDGSEYARLPRRLEHEYQQLAAELRVPQGNPERQEARFPCQLGDFCDERVLARVLSRLLFDLYIGCISTNRRKKSVISCTTFHLLLTKADFRRHVRPFFLTPDGQRPTPYKRYYDILSYVTTQVAFCFTTAPFVLLTLPDSLLVWARVYFYAIIGVAASMAFFASPAKQWLDQHLRARNHPIPRSASQETLDGSLMGLPSDPGRDFDEAMQEVRDEVEARRRKGTNVAMPRGEQLKSAVADKLGKEL